MMDYTQFEGHTPGPWGICPPDDDGGGYEYDGQFIANEDSYLLRMIDDRNIVDARLIAAAPDLLARCKALEAEKTRLELAISTSVREAICIDVEDSDGVETDDDAVEWFCKNAAELTPYRNEIAILRGEEEE